MAFSRLCYDTNAYSSEVAQSTGTLGYLLNPVKYENCHKCRANFGIVGGPEVSLNDENMVDVESELSGRTRPLTKGNCGKYTPTCSASGQCKSDSGVPFDCDECQPVKKHLRTCQIVKYPPRIDNVGYRVKQPTCEDVYRAHSKLQKSNSTLLATDVQPYKPSAWQGNTGLAAW